MGLECFAVVPVLTGPLQVLLALLPSLPLGLLAALLALLRHSTDDARVVCLDVRRGGEILWTFRTGSHVESSPCIYRDRVYIGAGDDGYYCLRLEPDANGRPVMLWHAAGERYPDAGHFRGPRRVCVMGGGRSDRRPRRRPGILRLSRQGRVAGRRRPRPRRTGLR